MDPVQKSSPIERLDALEDTSSAKARGLAIYVGVVDAANCVLASLETLSEWGDATVHPDRAKNAKRSARLSGKLGAAALGSLVLGPFSPKAVVRMHRLLGLHADESKFLGPLTQKEFEELEKLHAIEPPPLKEDVFIDTLQSVWDGRWKEIIEAKAELLSDKSEVSQQVYETALLFHAVGVESELYPPMGEEEEEVGHLLSTPLQHLDERKFGHLISCIVEVTDSHVEEFDKKEVTRRIVECISQDATVEDFLRDYFENSLE